MPTIDPKVFVRIMEPFVRGMLMNFDTLTWDAYHENLGDIPQEVLIGTLAGLQRSGIRFFPKAPELRQHCEEFRRALLKAMPFMGCAACIDSKGWATTTDERGITRVTRCPCVAKHTAVLAARGLTTSFSELSMQLSPGDAERLEFDRPALPAPTLDTLPPPIQSKLRGIIGGKQLR